MSSFMCCCEGSIDMMRYLISKGADINAKDEGGRNAIFYAIESGQIEKIILLLDNQAELNKDGQNRSPAEYCLEILDRVRDVKLHKTAYFETLRYKDNSNVPTIEAMETMLQFFQRDFEDLLFRTEMSKDESHFGKFYKNPYFDINIVNTTQEILSGDSRPLSLHDIIKKKLRNSEVELKENQKTNSAFPTIKAEENKIFSQNSIDNKPKESLPQYPGKLFGPPPHSEKVKQQRKKQRSCLVM